VPTPGRTARPASGSQRTVPEDVPPRPWRKRGRFTALLLIVTVTAVMSSLGNPLIPQVADQYDVPLSSAQWMLTAALLAAAVATPSSAGSVRAPGGGRSYSPCSRWECSADCSPRCPWASVRYWPVAHSRASG
jgi:hypothetical protein